MRITYNPIPSQNMQKYNAFAEPIQRQESMLSNSIENKMLIQNERPKFISAYKIPGAQMSPSLHQQHSIEE